MSSEEDEIIFEPDAELLWAVGMFADAAPERSLVDELLAERKAEALRESENLPPACPEDEDPAE